MILPASRFNEKQLKNADFEAFYFLGRFGVPLKDMVS